MLVTVTWRGSTGLPWSDVMSDDIMPDDVMSDDVISGEGEEEETPTPVLTAFLLRAAADTLAALLLLLVLLLLPLPLLLPLAAPKQCSEGDTHRLDLSVDGGLGPSNGGRLTLVRLDSDDDDPACRDSYVRPFDPAERSGLGGEGREKVVLIE